MVDVCILSSMMTLVVDFDIVGHNMSTFCSMTRLVYDMVARAIWVIIRRECVLPRTNSTEGAAKDKEHAIRAAGGRFN